MANGFITKIDYSDNRQIKQRILTDTTLSGSTTLGTDFSDLPSGPDPSNSGITETLSNIYGTFSGNTGTTVFTYDDARLNLGDSQFSAITLTNSGDTQDTGIIFTGYNQNIVDGNISYSNYSGVSFTLFIDSIEEIATDTYTGQTMAQTPDILSANTLDYTGRTIWLNVLGILSATTLYGDGSNLTGIPTTSYTEKTGNYTATTSNNTINCIGNSFTITLPTAVGNVGKIFNIKNSATGTTITVDPYGSETIDGEVTQRVTNPDNLQIQSTGSNWIIL
jgi:hypothetical protein